MRDCYQLPALAQGRESLSYTTVSSSLKNNALKQRMSGRGISKHGRKSICESVRENNSRVGFTHTSMHAWDWLFNFLFEVSMPWHLGFLGLPSLYLVI
jgi:hypothetical protein